MPRAMDRKFSASSDAMSAQYATSTPLPPWETREVAQVPFMDPGSPPLSKAERQALPSLWATRSSTNSSSRPRLDTGVSAASSAYGSPSSPQQSTDPWSKVATPLTAIPPPAPYESPVYIPPAPKTAPQLPPFVVQHPPTPPDSVTRSCSSSMSTTSSPRPRVAVKALPGTMSSRAGRDRTPTRTRVSSATREQRARNVKKSSSVPFSKRFRSAFKDIFKREPVDESQFEHIDDRHWTDEY